MATKTTPPIDGIAELFYLIDILEARVGIEPTHKGFADLSLTTWVPRLTARAFAHARIN